VSSPSANTVEFFSAAPRPPLHLYVECIWAVRGSGDYRRAQVLPNGALQLMINFGAPHRVLGFGSRSVVQEHRQAWVAGVQDAPLTIESPDHSDLLAIRFRPGGAFAFLPLPVNCLTNDVVCADALLGSAAADLQERASLAVGRQAQLRAVEDWLLARFAPREHEHGLVCRAVALLNDPGEPGSVRATCERLGLSNRYLIELFRRHVGFAPKTLARITRFHAALDRLAQGATRSEIALDLGYADQAHFNHEFRRFAGATPSEFMARRAPDNESLIV
jgi:AraC-like DNA-binding protein